MIVGAGVEFVSLEVMIGVELVSVEEAAEVKLGEEKLSVEVERTDSLDEAAPSASLVVTEELTAVKEDVAGIVSVSASDWVLETLSSAITLLVPLAVAVTLANALTGSSMLTLAEEEAITISD